MHEGETGPAQGAPLGSFGVASACRHFFPLRTTVATKGEEGRGAVGHGPPEPISSVPSQHASTNQHHNPSSSSPSSSRGRLLRNAPHQGGVLRAVKAVPKHGSPQHKKKRKSIKPLAHATRRVGWCVYGAFSSSRLFLSQAHRNRSNALLLIFKGAGAVSGMVHHTKVNDCVTEAGCNKQPGMTHFPEGWTRLRRRHRWLASPSELARERAREKKKKKRGHGPSQASFAEGAVAMVEGGIHRREKEKNSWLGRGRLAGWGWARTGTCQTGPPTLCAHTTLPRSIGPKSGPVKPLTRKQAVKSGALCPLPAFPAGPSPRGPNRGKGAGNQGAPSVPRGGEGMADAFQVWARRINSLAHSLTLGSRTPRDAGGTS